MLQLPFSIFTATVLQVEILSMPNAEASTTFPNAPWPKVLPVRERKRERERLHELAVSWGLINQAECPVRKDVRL